MQITSEMQKYKAYLLSIMLHLCISLDFVGVLRLCQGVSGSGRETVTACVFLSVDS